MLLATKRSIANVLGCGLVIALISGCASTPRTIEISAKPIDKPQLVLPKADKLILRDFNWIILTEQNHAEVIAKLSENGKRVALFALTDDGYEAIALNISDIRAFIQQQQAIIAAYEGYYKETNSALDAANEQIEKAKTEVTDQSKEPEKSGGFFGLFK